MPSATVLPTGRFEVLEDEAFTTLTRRRPPVRLVLVAGVLVAVAAALPAVVGEGAVFAPIFPGILLTIAIFAQTNQLSGRGFYFRLRRELTVTRAPAGSYRDARGTPQLRVDGRAIAGQALDVVVRTTPGRQPAWQVYVLLADGGLVHVAGSVEPAEVEALRQALRAAVGLPEDRTSPAPDAIEIAALLVDLALIVVHVVALVAVTTWAVDLGRGAPLVGGAVAGAGVLLACAAFAGAIALCVRPAMRSWVRKVHGTG